LLVKPTPRNVSLDSDRFAMFKKERDIPAMAHRADSLDIGRRSQPPAAFLPVAGISFLGPVFDIGVSC
jgi:hypothetical protein